jgi:hypothetical protein
MVCHPLVPTREDAQQGDAEAERQERLRILVRLAAADIRHRAGGK